MLGRGTFGIVTKETLAGHDAPVACKSVKVNNDFMSREIEITTLLLRNPHENIVEFLKLESCKEVDRIYMTMCPTNLRSILTRLASKNYRIKEVNAVRIVFGLSKALLHLKTLHIMHRDLKPENVLLTAEYCPLLCDFGSAKVKRDSNNVTYIVSRFYRAPELLLERSYSYEIDVWSLGCVLGELCVGP